MSESSAQALVRIATSQAGWRLWRNNVGVLRDERGVPIRFGLANDSRAVNANIKSADLIGIRPLLITPDMVGTTIGQFVSIEMKEPGWRPLASDKRYAAQRHWAELVQSLGGFACFSTGEIDMTQRYGMLPR